jgi:thiol:disulfide interchange protein DsbD
LKTVLKKFSALFNHPEYKRPIFAWFFYGILTSIITAEIFMPKAVQATLISSASVVKIEGYSSLAPAHPGEIITLGLQLNILSPWHIEASHGLPHGFFPLKVSLKSIQGVQQISSPSYPTPKLDHLKGFPKSIPVYQGSIPILVAVHLPSHLNSRILKIPFQVQIQACNNQVCLRPSRLSIIIPIQINSSIQRPAFPASFQKLLNQESFQKTNIIAKILKSKGWILTFVLIFLGGLALNLTPCVYPMIPITISFFGSRKNDRASIILLRAIAYVVGISVTYSLLGITAALTGKILGSTLQSPLILVGISIFLIILSLSMFGVYDIQAPAWLLNRISGATTQGLLGAFGMGLVFGVVAAPCVDPFSIGLLTYVATQANPWLGFFMFFTLSLGLGFPYIWLGFFSTSIQKLPRSGLWMVWVRKVFGLILLGMPFYFLNPLLPKHFDSIAVPLYLMLAGLLLGWWTHQDIQPSFKRFQRIFGIGLVILGIGLLKFWPHASQLPFQPYNQSTFQEAYQSHQSILIDFTANWCLPCREIELQTFSNPQIHQALKHWTLLKADLTQYASPAVSRLRKRFHVLGVPTLLFITPMHPLQHPIRHVGFISAAQLLKILKAF